MQHQLSMSSSVYFGRFDFLVFEELLRLAVILGFKLAEGGALGVEGRMVVWRRWRGNFWIFVGSILVAFVDSLDVIVCFFLVLLGFRLTRLGVSIVWRLIGCGVVPIVLTLLFAFGRAGFILGWQGLLGLTEERSNMLRIIRIYFPLVIEADFRDQVIKRLLVVF
ncbi:hypothetical protein KC349_g200 [Hortaea werneckii]|nr:hypothetical protein KC349_g200 [Hortaea werneckii]